MRRSKALWIRYWLPPTLWASAIFVASSLSAPSTPSLPVFIPEDKLAHMLLFGILAWLVYRALMGANGKPPRASLFIAFAAAAIYGGLDELHQGLVPTRQADILDWVADVLGAALTLLLVARFGHGEPAMSGSAKPPAV